MKGLALISKGHLKIINKKEPILKSQYGAILKPILVTPCTSDVHTIFSGGLKPKNLIMGHECIARIEKLGSKVNNLKVNDIVLVSSITPNWSDKNVSDNLSHAGGHFSGHQLGNKIDGCFCEKFYLDYIEKNSLKVPKNSNIFSLLMCADMMPTAYTGIKSLNLKNSDVLCVFGIGAVGLCSIMIAKYMGVKKIFAVGSKEHNMALAKSFGALVLNYKKIKTKLPSKLDKRSNATNSKIVNEILKQTNYEGVDKVLICGGDSTVLSEACDIVKYGTGIISNLAYFSDKEFILPSFSLGKGMAGKEIKFLLSDGGVNILKKVVSISKKLKLDKLITKYDMQKDANIEDRLNAIYDSILIMKKKPNGIIKIAIPME